MSSEQSICPSQWALDLEAARLGDRDALGKLLQSHWRPLWRHAKLQVDESLQGKQAASDLVQETFIEAHQCFVAFRGSTPGELQAWLRAMLANNVRDAWRRYSGSQKRMVSLELPLSSADKNVKKNGNSGLNSPSAHLHQQETIDEVHRILNALPEHYATVIRLRHWEALTFETIATKMNKSPDGRAIHCLELRVRVDL